MIGRAEYSRRIAGSSCKRNFVNWISKLFFFIHFFSVPISTESMLRRNIFQRFDRKNFFTVPSHDFFRPRSCTEKHSTDLHFLGSISDELAALRLRFKTVVQGELTRNAVKCDSIAQRGRPFVKRCSGLTLYFKIFNYQYFILLMRTIVKAKLFLYS